LAGSAASVSIDGLRIIARFGSGDFAVATEFRNADRSEANIARAIATRSTRFPKVARRARVHSATIDIGFALICDAVAACRGRARVLYTHAARAIGAGSTFDASACAVADVAAVSSTRGPDEGHVFCLSGITNIHRAFILVVDDIGIVGFIHERSRAIAYLAFAIAWCLHVPRASTRSILDTTHAGAARSRLANRIHSWAVGWCSALRAPTRATAATCANVVSNFRPIDVGDQLAAGRSAKTQQYRQNGNNPRKPESQRSRLFHPEATLLYVDTSQM
jgi:hypothetical protein